MRCAYFESELSLLCIRYFGETPRSDGLEGPLVVPVAASPGAFVPLVLLICFEEFVWLWSLLVILTATDAAIMSATVCQLLQDSSAEVFFQRSPADFVS